MASEPLVSVIVPTYQRNDLLLERCLPSLFAQTYKNIEIVVISDGPNQDLKNLLPSSVKYFELGRNWGCFGGHSKLAGSYMTSGQFICYLDDDDAYLPNHIESLMNLQQQTSVDFVYSKMYGHTKDGSIVTVGDGEPAFMKIGTPMIMHKAELFYKNNWQPSGDYCDDWELVHGWLKAGATYRFLNKITVLLRGATLPMLTTSIVIPTYNHLDDCLKPCIESIISYSDLNDIEIVVVANGCKDDTRPYLNHLQGQGLNVNIVWFDEPLGYTKAANEGIKAATGEFVVLMNNDTILLPQPRQMWLDMMKAPLADSNIGITGPLKFNWTCGETERTCMAFWLVMVRRSLFDKLGLLDEAFSPGMGEDADFCCKIEEAGLTQIQVPSDGSHQFGEGSGGGGFPIYHLGNGTFGDDHNAKNNVIERNTNLLRQRYGDPLERAYRWCHSHVCDINEHFPALRKYASECSHITEFGVRDVFSTIAFFAGRPKKIFSYDIYESPGIDNARHLADVAKIDFTFVNQSTLDAVIEPTDLLFIDTKHTYGQLKAELQRHASKVSKYIILHDTVSFGEVGENEEVGLMPAINEFLTADTSWEIAEHFQFNNGVMVLRKKPVSISIVIPTFNRCDELLKPCIESIKEYTTLSDKEIIVVANGCTDNTREYVESQTSQFKLVWFDDALGYTKATNAGIKQAKGEFVVLLNNDSVFLKQIVDDWVRLLVEPFYADETVGLSGPLALFDNYAAREILIFFCVMIRRKLFDEIGLLDEIYSPGGGEDIDFCAKAADLGYRCVRVPTDTPQLFDGDKKVNVGNFAIYHMGEGTFDHIPEYGKYIIKRNGLINAKKYNKHIKLDLGCGPIPTPGYLGVDTKDSKADILMDVTKLDFDDNTIEEILASHLFEHLNPYKVMDILKEWKRVLKPGGKLIMEMPDIVRLCEEVVKGDKQTRYAVLNAVYGAVNTTGVGDPSEITSPHLWGWWPEAVFDHLAGAGFVDIQVMPEQLPHPWHNFRVECKKGDA